MRDRPGARCRAGDVLLRMGHTHKMATNTSGNASRALFDSLAEFIYSKGSSSVSYRANWCVNPRLESNQFISRHDEVEDEEITSQVEKRFFCLKVT